MSKYLSPKLIIAEAWEMTKEHKKELFWYGFVPAFFGMIVSTVYVLYQFFAFRHFILGERDTLKYGQILQEAWQVIRHTGGLPWFIIVFAAIVLIGYFFVPAFCRGALVFLIEKIKKGEVPEKGFQAGLFRFLSVFEFGAISGFASPFSFLTEASFVLRNVPALFPLLAPILIILMFFGLIALFLFAYVPQAIILQRGHLMNSVAKSAHLSLHFFSETFRLFLLFLLIELRVLLNIIIILFLPVVVLAITSLFASTFLRGFGMVLSGLVVLFLLSVASTISGTLEIFSTAVWTLAFHQLTPEEEKTTEL